MAVEITTVPRVYIKDKRFWKSAHHTAWTAPPGMPSDPREVQHPLSLQFYFGLARNVPQNIYDAFAAVGIATTDRPRRAGEED